MVNITLTLGFYTSQQVQDFILSKESSPSSTSERMGKTMPNPELMFGWKTFLKSWEGQVHKTCRNNILPQLEVRSLRPASSSLPKTPAKAPSHCLTSQEVKEQPLRNKNPSANQNYLQENHPKSSPTSPWTPLPITHHYAIQKPRAAGRFTPGTWQFLRVIRHVLARDATVGWS